MKCDLKKVVLSHKRIIIAVVLAIITVVLSHIWIQPQIFDMEVVNTRQEHRVMEVILAIFMFLFFDLVIKLISKLIHKDKTYKVWLINFLVYAMIMTIVLIMIWPGRWVWDEFFILDSVVSSKINIWQSYLTVIYMSLCLMIIPLPVGIVIIQMLLMSAIFAYIATKVNERYKNKIINVILYIFMLTPAILMNNLYPLRLPMYSYIMLLFFAILLFDKMENKKLTLGKFLKLYILIIIMILWRSEGILFAVLAPILMLLVYHKKGINILKTIVLIVINFVIITSYTNTINGLEDWVKNSNNIYGLTIYINPLSEMLQGDLKGKNVEQNLQGIDKVLSIEVLKKYPSYLEIPAYWDDSVNLIRADYEKHLPELKKNYIELVLNNLGPFLKARMKTFLSTCGMYGEASAIAGGGLLGHYATSDEVPTEGMVGKFSTEYKYTKVINKDLKFAVETSLIGGTGNHILYNKIMRVVFWNPLIVIIVVGIAMIISFIKRNWIFLGIFISLLGNAGIIFLTAPANYFMYYLPVFICGIIISIIYLADEINKKKNCILKNDVI